MPAAPAAALQNPYDHFAIVRWDAPVDNGAAVTEYVYQLCETSDVPATCNDQNAPVRYMCAAGSQTQPCATTGGTAAAIATDFRVDADGSGEELLAQTAYTLSVMTRPNLLRVSQLCRNEASSGMSLQVRARREYQRHRLGIDDHLHDNRRVRAARVEPAIS